MLTFEPHPLTVIHPEAAPKLIMPFDVKRDVIEGLGVSELVVIPFDHGFSTIPPEEFCSTDPGRDASEPTAGLGGRELPLRRAGQGRPGLPALATGVRDPGRAAGGGRRRDRLVEPDPRAGRGRRRRGRDALPGRAVPVRGHGGRGRSPRPHARFPDRQRDPRRRVRPSRARRLCRVCERHPGGGQRRRPADLRDRPRRADRVLPDRRGRRPLREDPANRLHRQVARREAVCGGRGADRADAPRRRGGARALC